MSTLRINNIEAQSVPASPTIDEKVKVTNSSGDILVNIDGKTSGITTIGINTTDGNIKFDANSNVLITGILTATTLAGNFTPDSLEIGSNIKLGNAGVITATSFVGSGANLTGISQVGGSTGVDFNDNVKIRLGTGNDLQIYHTGSASWVYDNGTGPLYIGTNNSNIEINGGGSANDTMAKFKSTEGVELFYNNVKSFSTISNGIRVEGTEGASGLLELYADEGDDNGDKWRFIAETNGTLNLQDYGSGNWYNNIRFTGHTGGVLLFQDNDAKFQTQSDGVRVEDGGKLYLQNDSENAASYITNLESSGESNIIFNTYDGSSSADRWEITKDGHFIPQVNNDMDIGASSYRVRNIYTMDLHCSNKGSSNDVDGTWGDYTIQEGESDLFLINNRSGKKYKFNLTEVK